MDNIWTKDQQKINEPAKNSRESHKYDLLEKAIKRGAMSLADAMFMLDAFYVHKPLNIADLLENRDSMLAQHKRCMVCHDPAQCPVVDNIRCSKKNNLI